MMTFQIMHSITGLILFFGAFLFVIGSTKQPPDPPDYQMFPPSADVVAGEGLVIQAFPNNVSLKSCQVTIANLNFTFTDSNTKADYDISYWGNGVGNGDCGVRIEKYDPSHHQGTWRFTITPKNPPTSVKKIVKVVTSDPPDIPTGESMNTFLGYSAVINCFSPDSLHCVLINPFEEVYTAGKNCTTELASVRMRDVGVWQCQNSLKGIAEPVSTYFTIKVTDPKTIELEQIKTEHELNLQCRLLSSEYKVTDCQLQRPDGKIFMLKDGANSGRYTYYGKGIDSGACGVSIDLPLIKEDVGMWSCKMHVSAELTTGGFILVNPDKGNTVNKTAVILNSVESTNSISIRNGSQLVIGCSARSSLKYCWLRHPNGTRFTPYPLSMNEEYEYVGDGLELGQCGLKIPMATTLDSGVWTCGMGVDSDSGFSEDIQTSISVLVSVEKLVANRSSTTVPEGDWVILGCRSLLGEGLKYCSFVAPDGTGYSLTKSKESNHPRYSYTGNGLENGDCGLFINPVKNDDYGDWKCAAMLIDFRDSKEYYMTLTLQPPGFSTSYAIGIGVGILVVGFLALSFFVWHYRRHRTREIEPSSDHQPAVAEPPLSLESRDSELSEEVAMFSIEMTRRPRSRLGPTLESASEGEEIDNSNL